MSHVPFFVKINEKRKMDVNSKTKVSVIKPDLIFFKVLKSFPFFMFARSLLKMTAPG